MNIEKVSSQFQLLSTTVVELQATNSFLFYDERKSGKKEIDVSYSIKQVSSIEDENNRIGVLDLIITISSEIEDRKYNFKMVIRGFFEAPLDMDENTFGNMLRVNGCAALYSTARGIICGISSQMFAVGNVVLPMVNFIHFHEIEQQS